MEIIHLKLKKHARIVGKQPAQIPTLSGMAISANY
jgi:hypothetical protein